VPFTVDEARIRGGKELDLNHKWFWRAAYVEVLLSFVFVCLYIQIWKRNGASYFILNALMSGLGLFVTSYIAIGISGGCLNPMIALVQSPFALVYSGILQTINADQYSFTNVEQSKAYAMFILAPLLGGILAGVWQGFIVPII